jgi:hypothetical protein
MKNCLDLVAIGIALGSIVPNGNEEKSLPKVGRYRGKSVTRYIAGDATQLASNNGSTIVAGTLKSVGTTNFEKGNTLPKGTQLLVTGIRVVYDTTGAATVLNADWAEVAPVCFKNGELTINQKGQGTLFNASGTDVTNFKASTGNDADFRDVVPFLIREEAEFDIVFTTAGAVTASLYKVELRCVQLTDGDKS